MATREGIYVGGHEIVERYVGNRLVWEKMLLVATYKYNLNDHLVTLSSSPYKSDRTSVFRVSEDLNISKIDGSILVKKDDVSFTNVLVSKILNSYGYFNNEFAIIFSSVDEKNRFNRTTGETKFYKKRGN